MDAGADRPSGIDDARLLLAARAGDAASLGMLLERHRAPLLATAVRLLGDPAEAEDAVQETFLVAVRRLAAVRDPAAAGGWLRAIVRNVCLDELRRASRTPVSGEVLADSLLVGSAEEEFARSALGDWVWGALESLSEPLRLPLLLRHFTGCASYDQIAAVCGIPIGTVRSRLNEGRRKLSDALVAEAARAEPDDRRAVEARARELEDAISYMSETGDARAFADLCAADVELVSHAERHHGREPLLKTAAADTAAGVRYLPTNIVSSRSITVSQGRFENPPDDPEHCPVNVVQIHYHPRGLTSRLTQHFPG
jgi:RNA polymerase sigma-70 factor (ECF subfamily)